MKSLIVTGILVAGIGIVGITSYISAYNTGNRLERTIEATFTDNQNVLAQYSNRIPWKSLKNPLARKPR